MTGIKDGKSTLNGPYTLAVETPSVDDYLRLRIEAGLSPRSRSAAGAGLPNTVIGVVVRLEGHVVAMGRVIGDGLFYQIVDIAVAPAHQQRGLGKAIVAVLLDELKRVAVAEAHVSLIADGQASELYAQYGFKATAPASIGMALWIGKHPVNSG